MKRDHRLIKAFGKNEADLADIPQKISNVTVARIMIRNETGCSFCFPHGEETVNSTIGNSQKNWKKYRKNQRKQNPSEEKITIRTSISNEETISDEE